MECNRRAQANQKREKIMSNKKEQRVVFVLTDSGDGNMGIGVDFFPRLAMSQESRDALTDNQKSLQDMAAGIGKAIMDGFQRGMVMDEQAEAPTVPNSGLVGFSNE